MRLTNILIIILTLSILIGVALFSYKNSLPDVNSIRNDVTERILKIGRTDSNINELVLRARYSIDQNYDNLTKATLELATLTDKFEENYFNDSNKQNNLLQKRFFNFKNAIEIKKDLVENFKSHNSILRNSEKYAPLVGKELLGVATKENNNEAKELIANIIRELLEFSLQNNSSSLEFLKFSIPQLIALEETMPEFTRTSMIEFENHIKTVIKEKNSTNAYLSKTLIADTNNQLLSLSSAWNKWLSNKESQQSTYNDYLLAYIAFLLLSVILVIYLLRKLYKSLDAQVSEQTSQVKKAYEDLKESESLLIQNEKMASLGQLVAGVAHEINTPLGYISNNVNTVKENINIINETQNIVDNISTELSQKPINNSKVSQLLKQLVGTYRKTQKFGLTKEINELLDDSSYGLTEISSLVNSLRDFGRKEQKNMDKADIHKGLEATIKICKASLGKRQLNTNFDEQIPEIDCMPTQINQVFMNILNNAIQATNEEDGIINITTHLNKDTVDICISDNGIGMSKDTVKKIFDPFYTTKEVGSGLGLGMSISYKIIKEHGGKISINSQENEGTSITISLPINQFDKKPLLQMVK